MDENFKKLREALRVANDPFSSNDCRYSAYYMLENFKMDPNAIEYSIKLTQNSNMLDYVALSESLFGYQLIRDMITHQWNILNDKQKFMIQSYLTEYIMSQSERNLDDVMAINLEKNTQHQMKIYNHKNILRDAFAKCVTDLAIKEKGNFLSNLLKYFEEYLQKIIIKTEYQDKNNRQLLLYVLDNLDVIDVDKVHLILNILYRLSADLLINCFTNDNSNINSCLIRKIFMANRHHFKMIEIMESLFLNFFSNDKTNDGSLISSYDIHCNMIRNELLEILDNFCEWLHFSSISEVQEGSPLGQIFYFYLMYTLKIPNNIDHSQFLNLYTDPQRLCIRIKVLEIFVKTFEKRDILVFMKAFNASGQLSNLLHYINNIINWKHIYNCLSENVENEAFLQEPNRVERYLKEAKVVLRLGLAIARHILLPCIVACQKGISYVSPFAPSLSVESLTMQTFNLIMQFPDLTQHIQVYQLWKDVITNLVPSLDDDQCHSKNVCTALDPDAVLIKTFKENLFQRTFDVLIGIHLRKGMDVRSLKQIFSAPVESYDNFNQYLWFTNLQMQFDVNLLNLWAMGDDEKLSLTDPDSYEDGFSDENKTKKPSSTVEEYQHFCSQARQECRLLLSEVSRAWPNRVLNQILQLCLDKIHAQRDSASVETAKNDELVVNWETLAYLTVIYKKVVPPFFHSLSDEVKQKFLHCYRMLMQVDVTKNNTLELISDLATISQTHSYILSCLSNFKSLLSLFPHTQTFDYFYGLLQMIFKCMDYCGHYEKPGSQLSSQVAPLKELTRHASALLIVLAQNNTVNLSPHFGHIKSQILHYTRDGSPLSYTNKFTLIEALILLWNQNGDSQEKLHFYQNLLKMPFDFWTSEEFRNGALTSTQAFINFFGLHKEPRELDLGGGLNSDYPFNKTGYSLLALMTVANRYEFKKSTPQDDCDKFVADLFIHLSTPFVAFAQNALSLFDHCNDGHSLLHPQYIYRFEIKGILLRNLSILDVPEAERRNITNNFTTNLANTTTTFTIDCQEAGGDRLSRRLLEVNKFFTCSLDRIFRLLGIVLQKLNHASTLFATQDENLARLISSFFSGQFLGHCSAAHVNSVPLIFQAKSFVGNVVKPLLISCASINSTNGDPSNFGGMARTILAETSLLFRLSHVFAAHWCRRASSDDDYDYCNDTSFHSPLPSPAGWGQYDPWLKNQDPEPITSTNIDGSVEVLGGQLMQIDDQTHEIIDDYLVRTFSKEYFELLLLIFNKTIPTDADTVGEGKPILDNLGGGGCSGKKDKGTMDVSSSESMSELGKYLLTKPDIVATLVPIVFRTLTCKDKSLNGKAFSLAKAFIREFMAQKVAATSDRSPVKVTLDDPCVSCYLLNSVLRALTSPLHSNLNNESKSSPTSETVDSNYLNLALWTYQVLRPLAVDELDAVLVRYMYKPGCDSFSTSLVKNDELASITRLRNIVDHLLIPQMDHNHTSATAPPLAYSTYLDTLLTTQYSPANFRYKRDIFKDLLLKQPGGPGPLTLKGNGNLVESTKGQRQAGGNSKKHKQRQQHRKPGKNSMSSINPASCPEKLKEGLGKSRDIYKVDNRTTFKKGSNQTQSAKAFASSTVNSAKQIASTFSSMLDVEGTNKLSSDDTPNLTQLFNPNPLND